MVGVGAMSSFQDSEEGWLNSMMSGWAHRDDGDDEEEEETDDAQNDGDGDDGNGADVNVPDGDDDDDDGIDEGYATEHWSG